MNDWQIMVISVGLTTVCWLPFAWIGQTTDLKTEEAFRQKANPGGVWRETAGPVSSEHPRQEIKWGIMSALFATLAIYCALFAAGEFIYGRYLYGALKAVGCILFSLATYRTWKHSNK